jgi:membrane protein implicated in regulation of membrane protease activity
LDLNWLFWFWLGVGIALILSEIIIPGGIVIFMGAAALVVAALLYTGMFTGWLPAIVAWLIFSLVFILALRRYLTKLIEGDSRRSNTDEDLDAIGTIVEVVETIGPGDHLGRISFRGTTWGASARGATFATGSKVKIVQRDNINWIVEGIDPS